MSNRRLLSVAILSTLVAAPLVAAPTALAKPAAPAAVSTTWTADSADNSISQYATGASGTDAPLKTISGADTGLDAPSAIAVSASGRVFVTNAGNDSITSYAADATDDAEPLSTIAGPKTGLDGPTGLILVGGALWLTNPASDLVESFSASSSGNTLPAQTIVGPKTKLDHPIAMTIGDIVPLLTVLNTPSAGKPSIETFLLRRPGNIAPKFVIKSSKKNPLGTPTALLAANEFRVWVLDGAGNQIKLVDALPLRGGHVRRAITGADTGLDAPSALSRDALGNLIVANAGDHSVLTFAGHAKGDATPINTLSGVGSAAGSPSAVTVTGSAPGAPTDLTVTIHGTTATMRWKPPVADGGGVIGYNIEAFHVPTFLGGGLGGLGLITQIGSLLGGTHVDTTATHFAKTIKPGRRYLFAVTAVNAFGESTGSNKVHEGIVTRPGAPRSVKVKARHREIAVSWHPPALDGAEPIQRYIVKFATCDPVAKGCHAKTVKVRRFQFFAPIGGLKPKTTYDVRVFTKTAKGLSKPSRLRTATTGK